MIREKGLSVSVFLFHDDEECGEAILRNQNRRFENWETVYKAHFKETSSIITNYPFLYTLFGASINTFQKIPLS